jgi:hypothetical protein
VRHLINDLQKIKDIKLINGYQRWSVRGRQFDPTSPNSTPRLNPHRAAAPSARHSPAISCLGAFPTPASELAAGLMIAGVRKPAHNRTFSSEATPTKSYRPPAMPFSLPHLRLQMVHHQVDRENL